MINIIYCGYFLLGLFSSSLILNNGIKFFKKFFLDNPNKRSLHIKPVPSAGGLSFIVPLLIYDFISDYFKNFENSLSLSLLCIPLIFISFLDDLLNVSSKYRYLIQLITAFIILRFSNINLFLINPLSNVFILIFLVIFITASINFTNFMDGSDGLVAGCMFVLFLIINIKLNSNISIIILLGSLAAFIYWNWSPARIFMGDIGSTFLGAYFVANVLQFNDMNEIIGLTLIASPIYGDAFITIIRRFFKRQNIFKAHRQHLYQRLYIGKLSKNQVAILYIFQSSMIGFVYLKLNFIYEIGTIFACLFIMYLLEIKYAVSFDEAMNNKLI
tara:strand:+ start:968 stop:1954 length:987 start_codon:yes stop_codon:yes gene_type:complete